MEKQTRQLHRGILTHIFPFLDSSYNRIILYNIYNRLVHKNLFRHFQKEDIMDKLPNLKVAKINRHKLSKPIFSVCSLHRLFIVLGGESGSLLIWRLIPKADEISMIQLHKLKAHRDSVYSLVPISNSFFASGEWSHEGLIVLWTFQLVKSNSVYNIAKPTIVIKVNAYNEGVYRMLGLPLGYSFIKKDEDAAKGLYCISGMTDGTILLINFSIGKASSSLIPRQKCVMNCFLFFEERHNLVYVDDINIIRTKNIKTKAELANKKKEGFLIQSLCRLNDSLYCSGDDGGLVCLWELETANCLYCFSTHYGNAISSLKFDYLEEVLYSVGEDGVIVALSVVYNFSVVNAFNTELEINELENLLYGGVKLVLNKGEDYIHMVSLKN